MAAKWADEIVTRLAAGEDLEGLYDGLLLITSWPMPHNVQSQYNAFRKQLISAMPPQAYVYPSSTLHCTIATLRPFKAGKLEEPAASDLRAKWVAVLEQARAMEGWPSSTFRLKMNKPTLEGSAAVFRYDDVDGAIGRMRDCLREAIKANGGIAAEGSGDRSKAKAIDGSPSGEVPPHLPDIVHSTVMRWSDEVADKATVQLKFKELAATWEPVEITACDAWAIQETVPFMHIRTTTQPWWTSTVIKQLSPAMQWLKEIGEGFLSIVLPFIYIYVIIMISGKMPGKAGSDMKLHPLAN